MTVIAWDGHTLAADTQSTYGETTIYQQKIHRVGGVIYAASGVSGEGNALREWHIAGAIVADYPKTHTSEDIGANLVVVTKDELIVHHHSPYPVIYKYDDLMAWGSGSEIALSALHCGRSAIEAVELACKLSVNCGGPVESFTVDSLVAGVAA